MPPGTKLPPFLRSLLTRVSAHHPAPARYGRLNPRPGRPADPLLRQQLPHGWAQPHYYYQGKPNTSASYPSLSQHLAQRLCAHFIRLLRTLDFTPLLRGAGSVFRGLPSQNAYHQSLQSIRHAAARNSASWARFAAVRARPTPGAHMLQGPGLQMARNFSSGAAGPKMAFMITNAPLALRLGGDEIRDMRKAGYATGKPGQASSRRHRHSPRRSHAPVKPVKVELPRMTARQADKAPEQQQSASGSASAAQGLLPAEEMSFYFPEAPNATTAAPAVVTELIIPMEPDLVTILSHPSPFDEEEHDDAQHHGTHRMLDGQLRNDTLRTSDAYTLHKQKMRALWRLLEEMDKGSASPSTTPLPHAWRVRDSDVEFLPQTAHHVGYRVRIKGYSVEEVKELLVARLGKRHGGWFGQLVWEVPATPTEPASPSMGSTSSSDGSFSMLHAPPSLNSPRSDASSSSDRFSDDSGFLASPPSPAAASSSSRATWSSSSSPSSSSSSMLHSPPSLSFSATFSSRLRHGRNDEDEDEEWLQDSRI